MLQVSRVIFRTRFESSQSLCFVADEGSEDKFRVPVPDWCEFVTDLFVKAEHRVLPKDMQLLGARIGESPGFLEAEKHVDDQFKLGRETLESERWCAIYNTD